MRKCYFRLSHFYIPRNDKPLAPRPAGRGGEFDAATLPAHGRATRGHEPPRPQSGLRTVLPPGLENFAPARRWQRVAQCGLEENPVPTQYIHEDHVTVGDDLLFPNVRSCAAIIVQTTRSTEYGGYHTTVASSNFELRAACAYMISKLEGAVSGIYVIGNYARTSASGGGANFTLGSTLKGMLYANCDVLYLQSLSAWITQGIAVHVTDPKMRPGPPEVRVALPDRWTPAAVAPVDANMRRVKSSGGAVMPNLPMQQTATIPEAPKPWALASLERAEQARRVGRAGQGRRLVVVSRAPAPA